MQKNTDFQFITDEVESELYTVEVLPKPVTLGFVMELHYPAYLNKPDETIENVGNATVPEGTSIKWTFYTRNSENLFFFINDNEHLLTSENDNYIYKVVAKTSFTYSILNKNRYFTSKDTLTDEINVIQDMYPKISVESQRDSSYQDRIYFKGNINDDYGFSKLQFVYTKYDANGKQSGSAKTVDIKIQPTVTIQDFYYYFDPNTFSLDPGEKIDYYFQVFDNDGVNGHKCSKSSVSTFKVRTLDEINEDLEKSEKQTKSDFNDVLKESSQLMKDIDKLQQQMLQEKELSWQDKKKLEHLMEQYQELQKQINELKQQQQNQNNIENQYKDLNDDVIKKQKELQKRMDEILSDEMKEMIQKLQEMMNNSANKDQLQKQMQKMKLNTQDINQTLDQQLQLYKQLEVEKKINEAIQDLRNLSSELQQNAKQTQNKNINKGQLEQKQNQIQQKFEQIQKDINEINQLNNQLEDPNKLQSTEQLQEDAKQQLQQSQSNLDKNNRQKSSQNQTKAAEDMDKIADQLEKDFNESELENVSEDIETLRQILDNLVKISFSQEEVMKSTQKVNARSASVSDLMTRQFRVKNNMKIIEDSLNALARRQTSVRPFIQTEVSKIQDYLLSSFVLDFNMPLSNK